jgi:hypothetical protein
VEIAWQNCTRKADNNLVADLEVARATDDAANVFATISGLLTFCGNSNLAPANGLSVALWLRDELKDLTDHDRAGYTKSV